MRHVHAVNGSRASLRFPCNKVMSKVSFMKMIKLLVAVVLVQICAEARAGSVQNAMTK